MTSKDPKDKPMREHVVDTLRGEILALRFEPGKKLVERKLCEMTGASRTALREGLRQLEAEGLIEIVPNRGPIVPRLTATQARDIYAMRALLEGEIAALSAERASGRDLAELDTIAGQVTGAMEASDRLALISAKRAWYTWGLARADNVEMETVMWRLLGRSSLVWPLLMARGVADAEGSSSEIDAIADAIRAHDGAAARAAARVHMERAGAEVVAFLARDADIL